MSRTISGLSVLKQGKAKQVPGLKTQFEMFIPNRILKSPLVAKSKFLSLQHVNTSNALHSRLYYKYELTSLVIYDKF